MKRVTLKEAIRFHGHLGPYLVLGLMAGDLALEKLKANRHFGIEVKVKGATKKPKSCFIDGLQLSTGATYGKGNIKKIQGNDIRVTFRNTKNNKKLALSFEEGIIKKLDSLKRHRDSELFAKELYRKSPADIFISNNND